jgi:N6-L-threonylcarbamoyladenine synthase
MKILAIETSCDDTGIAVLEASGPKNSPKFNILSNIIASQIEIHKQYGGVYPFAAKREHQKNIKPTFETALRQAKIIEKDIDLIAVTKGPGLEPCLWVGVNFAQDLAQKLNIPLVPVNHIEGHILVNFLDNKKINFPAIALVTSGGHTQIILVKNIGKYKILGETRDDAAGECFDKCAKILGLSYPGGPEIAKLAEQEKAGKINLPRPMLNTKDYDFSFSGLKTAVLYYFQKNPDVNKNNFAAEIQQAIIDVLLKKTLRAAKDYKAKTIILGGGVSANLELKKQFAKKINSEVPGTHFLFPQIDHSTDNGLMTAITAYFHRNKKVAPKKVATIRADANLRIDDYANFPSRRS